MYKRDFGVLLLALCALYISLQSEGPFAFKKAWYHPFEHHDWLLVSEHPTPRPVVADLNGDGKPEVLAATPDGRLQLLAPRHHGDGFARAQLIAEVQPAEHPGKAPRIAALRTGYLTRPPGDLVRAPRKQVVLIVTGDLQVVCLDHNLKRLWSQDIKSHYPLRGATHEVAVHVSEHSVVTDDRGLVVVGASVLPLSEEEGAGDALEEEITMEGLEKMHTKSSRASAHGSKREGRHFSYFAFEGATGALRWKHEAEDFHRDLSALQDASSPQHSFHLAAELAEGRHYGEASCRDLRESVLRALPHSWHSNLDTCLQLAHFSRQRQAEGKQKAKLASNTRPATAPLATKKAAGDTAPANALVAHLEGGVEAIHLYSGRTVCRLHLPGPGMHADLNGDGVPDHVTAFGGDAADLDELHTLGRGHRHASYCEAVATTGIPPRFPLFNGTICRQFRGSLDLSESAGHVEVAPPVMLPVPNKYGQYTGVRQKGLAVFLNSRGELTAYNWKGNRLWQEAVGSTWATHAAVQGGLSGTSEPTLRAMALRTHAVPTVILAAGDHTAAIVSEHGNVLDLLDLPEAPWHLEVADFNFDGYSDLIAVGRGGLYAWAQVHHPGALPFRALVGGLIVVMGAVYALQQGLLGGEARPRGRSTDRVD